MSKGYLTCQEMVELVTEYLEGALSPADAALFEAHIAVCHGCTNYLWQIRDTIALSGKVTQDSLPVEARDSLLEAFRNWKRE